MRCVQAVKWSNRRTYAKNEAQNIAVRQSVLANHFYAASTALSSFNISEFVQIIIIIIIYFVTKQVQAVTWTPIRVTGQQGT